MNEEKFSEWGYELFKIIDFSIWQIHDKNLVLIPNLVFTFLC